MTDTFQRCGFPAPERASSTADLRRLLTTGSGRIVMTTVQKFEEALVAPEGELDVLDPSENVIVMVDEAHRTQYGTLGARMSKALPNAALLGFTGTPIDPGPARPSRAAASPGAGLTVQGSREPGSPSGRAHGGPGSPSSYRAGLTVQGSREHGLDRPDLRGPRPVQGRAHRPGLTVQALEARGHGSPAPSRPSKHESRAGRPRTVQGRAHGGPKATSWTGSRAHGPGPGSRRAEGHELDGLTVGSRAGPGKGRSGGRREPTGSREPVEGP